MRAPRRQSSTRDFSRPVLGVAIALIAMGVVLLVLSFALGGNPTLQAVGKGFRFAVAYAFLAGLCLLVVYSVLRPDPELGSPPTNGPTLFDKDSTDFVSHMDRDVSEDPSVPPQRR